MLKKDVEATAAKEMKAILLHGMGRTPLSMLLLKRRLAARGLKPTLFGYSAALESFERCVQRLVTRIEQTVGEPPYILIGHSLGTVIIRAALPRLTANSPKACFFLAPPSTACKAAVYFARNPVFKLLTGEMGQLLASEAFMSSLPVPQVPTKIYAGIGGPRGKWFPLGGEENDGLLTVSETRGALDYPVMKVSALHTWIMNSGEVGEDIVRVVEGV